MDNFTKEELEDIRLIYTTFCKDEDNNDRQLTNLESSIINKLQYMIDNCCDHRAYEEIAITDDYALEREKLANLENDGV